VRKRFNQNFLFDFEHGEHFTPLSLPLTDVIELKQISSGVPPSEFCRVTCRRVGEWAIDSMTMSAPNPE